MPARRPIRRAGAPAPRGGSWGARVPKKGPANGRGGAVRARQRGRGGRGSARKRARAARSRRAKCLPRGRAAAGRAARRCLQDRSAVCSVVQAAPTGRTTRARNPGGTAVHAIPARRARRAGAREPKRRHGMIRASRSRVHTAPARATDARRKSVGQAAGRLLARNCLRRCTHAQAARVSRAADNKKKVSFSAGGSSGRSVRRRAQRWHPIH